MMIYDESHLKSYKVIINHKKSWWLSVIQFVNRILFWVEGKTGMDLERLLAATKTLIINHEWTRMNTNLGQSTEYMEETECLADVGHRSGEFVDKMLFWSRGNREGIRLLGGSSRFAQAQTTTCGSLKSMICLFRRSAGASRDRQAHGKIFVKKQEIEQ